MNVFVLSTGRCGSVTFAAACRFIENYTAAHESKGFAHGSQASLPYQDFDYPADHIEVDNRLVWFLGRLNAKYGGDAFYVHLHRDRGAVAESFVRRWENPGTNIIRAYAWGPLTLSNEEAGRLSAAQRRLVAEHYWDTVNENIRHFLEDKPRQITIGLDQIESGFEDFWDAIGARGDRSSALQVLRRVHNASSSRGSDESIATGPQPVQQSVNSAVECSAICDRSDRERLAERIHHGASPPHTADPRIEATRIAIDETVRSFRRFNLAPYKLPDSQSSWSLDDPTLQFLGELVYQLKPQHILEFGSGVSTELLLRVTSECSPTCAISSVDHDPEFACQTGSGLEQANRLSLQVAPLVSRKFGNAFLATYLTEPAKFASDSPVDLCLIDGPPVALGGRSGTLYQVLAHCRPGSCVLLDDAGREDERAALDHWSGTLGDAIEIRHLDGFPKGLAVVVVHQPVAVAELWEHSVGAAAVDLNRQIPEGSRVLLINQWQWPEWFSERLGFEVVRDRSFPPADDDQAVTAIRSWAGRDVDYVAFGPAAFWWFECFPRLAQLLNQHGVPLVDNQRVVAYRIDGLRDSPDAAAALASSDDWGVKR